MTLKRDNPALANGQYGAPMHFIGTGNDKVLAYRRGEGRRAVQVVVNLSDKAQPVALDGVKAAPLAPWGWRIQAETLKNGPLQN